MSLARVRLGLMQVSQCVCMCVILVSGMRKVSSPSLFEGRQFLQAEDVLFTGRFPSYEESLNSGVQCFMLAIEVTYHMHTHNTIHLF